jgi:hypothetical protein
LQEYAQAIQIQNTVLLLFEDEEIQFFVNGFLRYLLFNMVLLHRFGSARRVANKTMDRP